MEFKIRAKNNEPGGLVRFVGNSYVYQAPKGNCFVATRAIGAHKALFSVEICLLWDFLEIKMTGAVYPKTPHSPLVCSMFNERTQ